MKPNDIESLSFKIIDGEAGTHDFTPEQWQIVRRMIHTTADFEYMKTVRFHPGSVTAGIDAIRNGKTIITDTNMARVGIRKGELNRFRVSVECLIDKPEVARAAKDQGTTRAKAAVDAALDLMDGGIYVVGNAPTALLQIIELVRSNKAQPALIVGLPVGFVNAAESKEELVKIDIPYISNIGRKGGSNVAAGVINALAIMAASQS
ncbi:MAG TPA: precorrin-8X methylmutase [Deltaproteobacteria bacterium]|nr:precorrin-8X methylmutase [Deltaproteobacteria bacterium]